MKKALNEEKERILRIMNEIDMTSIDRQQEDPKDVYEQENTNAPVRRLKVDDWVFMPINTFYVTVKDPSKDDDDEIRVTLKSKSDQTPIIIDIEPDGNFTEEELNIARKLVEKTLKTVQYPMSASFRMFDPDGTASFDY